MQPTDAARIKASRGVLSDELMFGRGKPPVPPKRASEAPKPAAQSWHAVDVVPGSWGCPEVKKLGGRRFLAADAPRIPLPECSAAWRCHCVYRHFADRRVGARRAVERIGLINTWFGAERRKQPGRRSGDGSEP